MSRAEDALMRLYESASLRDELTDEEAQQLLKWAEDEVVRLDESGADDDAFEARVDTLMRLLKQMNRYAGRQGQMSAQGVDQTPQQIAGLASELGHAADAAQIGAASTGDPLGTVQALTALFSMPETATTTANAPNDAESTALVSGAREAAAPETAATTANAPNGADPSGEPAASSDSADPIPHDEPPTDQPAPPVATTPTIDYLPLDSFGDDVEDRTDER